MKRVFLDSNIWLRLFTKDQSNQLESCRDLLTKIELGKLHPYISNIVLLEIAFTLKSFYKIKHNQVVKYLDTVFQTRNLTIIEKTNSKEALELHKKTGIKFSDCLIATQINSKTKLVTYDKDFFTLTPGQVTTPEKL